MCKLQHRNISNMKKQSTMTAPKVNNCTLMIAKWLKFQTKNSKNDYKNDQQLRMMTEACNLAT